MKLQDLSNLPPGQIMCAFKGPTFWSNAPFLELEFILLSHLNVHIRFLSTLYHPCLFVSICFVYFYTVIGPLDITIFTIVRWSRLPSAPFRFTQR